MFGLHAVQQLAAQSFNVLYYQGHSVCDEARRLGSSVWIHTQEQCLSSDKGNAALMTNVLGAVVNYRRQEVHHLTAGCFHRPQHI